MYVRQWCGFNPEDFLGTNFVSALKLPLLITLVGPTRQHLASQVEQIIRDHSRIQRSTECHPPPEAKFVESRILAGPRGPMIIDSPFGTPSKPNDLNIDDRNGPSHVASYLEFVSAYTCLSTVLMVLIVIIALHAANDTQCSRGHCYAAECG